MKEKEKEPEPDILKMGGSGNPAEIMVQLLAVSC